MSDRKRKRTEEEDPAYADLKPTGVTPGAAEGDEATIDADLELLEKDLEGVAPEIEEQDTDE
jgi:hypothetical protein